MEENIRFKDFKVLIHSVGLALRIASFFFSLSELGLFYIYEIEPKHAVLHPACRENDVLKQEHRKPWGFNCYSPSCTSVVETDFKNILSEDWMGLRLDWVAVFEFKINYFCVYKAWMWL